MERRFVILALAMGVIATAGPRVGAVWAQSPPARVSGVIASVHPASIVVKTSAGDVKLGVPQGVRITAVDKASLADIKKGEFVGSATTPGRNGAMIAVEVHIFSPSQRGTGEGSRPFPIVKNGTMTNADVTSVVNDVQGRVMTLTYRGGAKRITVPKGALIVRFSPGARSDLVVGARVSAFAAKAADGGLTATRISVGRNGARPPF